MKTTKLLALLTVSGATAVLASACATPTDDATADQYRDYQVAEAEAEGMVCTYEQVMGSLRRERVCRTQEEVERAAQEARQSTERYQRAAPGPREGL